mgnify:CR=1 FL=1
MILPLMHVRLSAQDVQKTFALTRSPLRAKTRISPPKAAASNKVRHNLSSPTQICSGSSSQVAR